MDSFTEMRPRERRGCFGSIFGAFIGIILLLGSIVLEGWNEGRAVNADRALQQGDKSVISLNPEMSEPSNNGKLVYLTGEIKTDKPLTDDLFGIKLDALVLKRISEKYQWHEHESHRTHGSQKEYHYTYDKNWSERLINSSNFRNPAGHQNPRSYYAEPATLVSNDAKIGKYTLDTSIIEKLNKFEKHRINSDAAIPQSVDGAEKVSVHDGAYYLGQNPAAPKVGDERVLFKFIPAKGIYSVIGRQADFSIQKYTAPNGTEIARIESGNVPSHVMFQHAEQENNMTTWMFRALGVVLMFIAFLLISGPLLALVEWIPFLGDLASFGAAILSACLSLSISLVTIGISWIAYRPILAVLLIVGAVALVAGPIFARSKR